MAMDTQECLDTGKERAEEWKMYAFFRMTLPVNPRVSFVNINTEKIYSNPNFPDFLLSCHNLSFIHVPTLLLIKPIFFL